MTPPSLLRKPKLYFDTAAHPSHVTFDDGKELRRNLPWLHYVEARWDHLEADILRLEIGKWVVIFRGHNLGPLFLAIEEQSLVRVRAQPELGQDPEREFDTFVSEMRFCRVSSKGPAGGQTELDLFSGT